MAQLNVEWIVGYLAVNSAIIEVSELPLYTRRGGQGSLSAAQFRQWRLWSEAGSRSLILSESMIMRLALPLVFVLSVTSVFARQQPPSAESEVRDTLAKFVEAFDNLDWEGFRLAFDDNATVFYPRAISDRATGRPEFERSFKVVFEQIRNGRTT